MRLCALNELGHPSSMRLLDTLASAFINTFGITQPSEAARRRASWFIAGMLLLVLLGVCTAGVLLYDIVRR